MNISEHMSTKLGFSSEVYQQLSQRLRVLDTFNGSWNVKSAQQGRILKQLREMAMTESAGSSIRMEGNETPDEQAIAGYGDALEVVLDSFTDLEISETSLHELHRILFKYREEDRLHRGNYRISISRLVLEDNQQTKTNQLNFTPPNLIGKEMQQLIEWLHERILHQDMHPLVCIAGFVYEFLCIRPYKEGNGVLSSLITTLLMLKLGYTFIKYESLEKVFVSSMEEYHRVLMDGQLNRNKEGERISAWVMYFIQCLITLTQSLEARYETFGELRTSLNKRQQRVLAHIRRNEPSQVGEIEKALMIYSRNTLKKDLAFLVREQLLVRTGEHKGSRYHLLKRD